MPVESAMVVAAIVFVFVGFAAVLAWSDFRSHRASRQ
jgi:hypothetical protein